MNGRCLCLLLFLVALQLAQLAAGQQMTIVPEGDQVRALGESALLTCRVNGRDPTTSTKLKWLDRNGTPIEITRGRVYIETDQNDRNMLKLYITNIINSDAGKYTCQEWETDRADGREVSLLQQRHVNLDIYKDITFEGCEHLQYPVLNSRATIRCKVSGAPNPSVYWRFQGYRITQETHPRYTQTDFGLEISNVQQSDSGTFTCVASVESSGKFAHREIIVEVHNSKAPTREANTPVVATTAEAPITEAYFGTTIRVPLPTPPPQPENAHNQVFYNYLDEVAQASCVGLWSGRGWIYAVRRNCATSGTCAHICANPQLRRQDSEVANRPMTCVNSLHVYANRPRLGLEYQSNTEKLGLKVYKYNECTWRACVGSGHCGPNFCCCVART